MDELSKVDDKESLILVATGSLIGESYSAGRIYDKIGKKAKGRVLYVMPKGILCELIM